MSSTSRAASCSRLSIPQSALTAGWWPSRPRRTTAAWCTSGPTTGSNPDFHLPAPGSTFAGRDVFAPVAAHLCNGVELDALGEPVDPLSLRPGMIPLMRSEDGKLVAEVLWIDRFGNAQLNVGPEEMEGLGSRIAVRAGHLVRHAVRAHDYAELNPGQLGLVVDSYGLVAVVLNRRPAAEELQLAAGDRITLEPAEQ